MIRPAQIERIGNEIAIRWEDGREDYITEERLRANSPSAENTGEIDLTGRVHGGAAPGTDYSHVRVTGWDMVGGYAVQFKFSDGHNTGLYSFSYLRSLAEQSA